MASSGKIFALFGDLREPNNTSKVVAATKMSFSTFM